MIDSLGSLLFTPAAGAWVGLLVTLGLASLLLGDSVLARLAQHVLVGAVLGYAALVALRQVLVPRLANGLFGNEPKLWLWLPLLLGLLMWIAGFDYLRTGFAGAQSQALPPWRRGLRLLGLLPVALMLGVGVAVALLGVVQGTLLPQLASVIRIGPDVGDPSGALAARLLMLVLTTATLIHLTVSRRQATATPRLLRTTLDIWRWLGARALWIAAGVLFARLAASRLSLLIGWMLDLATRLRATGVATWLQQFWN